MLWDGVLQFVTMIVCLDLVSQGVTGQCSTENLFIFSGVSAKMADFVLGETSQGLNLCFSIYCSLMAVPFLPPAWCLWLNLNNGSHFQESFVPPPPLPPAVLKWKIWRQTACPWLSALCRGLNSWISPLPTFQEPGHFPPAFWCYSLQPHERVAFCHLCGLAALRIGLVFPVWRR